MSRIIKFRAWSKENEEYIEDVIGGGAEWLKNNFYDYTALAEIFAGDEFVVEQYTGLKDKYGKEIYEGDIVALLYGYIPVEPYEKEQIKIDHAQKAVISYDDGKAAFRYTIISQHNKNCQFKHQTNKSMAVIGNIHENKELLGGEDGQRN